MRSKPTTVAGKRPARMNALTHGLSADYRPDRTEASRIRRMTQQILDELPWPADKAVVRAWIDCQLELGRIRSARSTRLREVMVHVAEARRRKRLNELADMLEAAGGTVTLMRTLELLPDPDEHSPDEIEADTTADVIVGWQRIERYEIRVRTRMRKLAREIYALDQRKRQGSGEEPE